MKELIANNAVTRLAEAVQTGDTVLKVEDGSVFPDPNEGLEFFRVTLPERVQGREVNWETCIVSKREGNELHVERAAEGTSESNWGGGTAVELRLTADAINNKRDALHTKMTVYIGPGGDFERLNDAIDYFSSYSPLYQKEGIHVILRLQEDYVMEEQVLVNDVDLGWMQIENAAGQGVSITDFEQGSRIEGYEQPEKTDVTVVDYEIGVEEEWVATAEVLNGGWLKLETAGGDKHYFWYNIDGGASEPQSTDGESLEGTGHEITGAKDEEASVIAERLRDAINAVEGFSAEVSGRNVTVENDNNGDVESVYGDERYQSWTVTQVGDEDQAEHTSITIDDYDIQQEITEHTSEVLNGNWVRIQLANGERHYFWFNANDNGTFPDLDGQPHEITVGETVEAPDVAVKLAEAIDSISGVHAEVDGRTVHIENEFFGDVDETDFSGDYLIVERVQPGRDQAYRVRVHTADEHGLSEGDRLIVRDHEGTTEEFDYNGVWYAYEVGDTWVELDLRHNTEDVYDEERTGVSDTGEVVKPAPVPVKREALTKVWEFFYYPAFGVARGRLPLIACEFEMDESGDNGYMSYKDGLCATDQGRIDILPFCGFSHAGGTNIYGTRSSVINANDAIASHAGRYGVWAYSTSLINARRVLAHDCGWAGVDEDRTNGFDGANQPVGNGIVADRGSVINAEGADASRSQGHGVVAQYGSVINVGGHMDELIAVDVGQEPVTTVSGLVMGADRDPVQSGDVKHIKRVTESEYPEEPREDTLYVITEDEDE